MADPQLVREWLNKAEDDFGFAASVIKESPYFAQICFHFHQAAEKYLKAHITENRLQFILAHQEITGRCPGETDASKIFGLLKDRQEVEVRTRKMKSLQKGYNSGGETGRGEIHVRKLQTPGLW